MKIKVFITFLSLLSLTLISCDKVFSSNLSQNNNSSNSTTSNVENSSSFNSSSSNSISNSTSTNKPTESNYLTVFSVNDFHGKIEQTSSYPGIVALQGAIRNNKNYNDNSIIVSSGDMFQGSYLSGKDYGLSTTKLMNNFPFEAMALGNHEFDWGINKIKDNISQASFPFLCANLLDSNNKQADFVTDHVTIEKGNYKVGIVGAIGANLESSIKASALENYSFSSNLTYLKNAYDKCIKEGADIVLLSLHDDEDSTYTNSIQNSSIPFAGILGGHSHKFQLENSNMPYVQGSSDSKGYSYIKIDTTNNTVNEINYVKVNATDNKYATSYFTELVDDLISKNPVQTIGYIKGYWTKEKAANLVLKAMFQTAINLYPEKNYSESNLIAIHNTGGIRGYFPNYDTSTPITMKDVQVISPFDNKVMLLENRPIVSSQVGDSSKNYSYPSKEDLNLNNKYDIVTIDYLVSDKYAPSMFTPKGAKPIRGENQEDYIIYDLVADYINNNSSFENPIDAKNF